MRKLLDKLQSRRGITMTEVIISMAVVTIVTGAAISVLIASMQFDDKYQAQTRAMNACESAVSCLRFTDNEAKLDAYLERLGFEESAGIYSLPDNDAVKVTRNGNSWTVIFDGETVYEKN